MGTKIFYLFSIYDYTVLYNLSDQTYCYEQTKLEYQSRVQQRVDRDPGWLFHMHPVRGLRVRHPWQPGIPSEHRRQGEPFLSLSALSVKPVERSGPWPIAKVRMLLEVICFICSS